MLEVIVLIFLTKGIGKLAHNKGLKPGIWKIYIIVSWIISEVTGIFVGLIIFGQDNLFSIFLTGLTFAITSYYIIKAQLNKLPDKEFDDDINSIGSN
ncbi:MAG: hypothetical protein M3Z26_06005 [Bacteroidota bacterium]|nr:hypothetical protein [Bacteroidota bacterium]